MLRGAVRAGVLKGWYWHGGGLGYPIRYVVHAGGDATHTYSEADTVAYCGMLRDAGVEPLYRDAGADTCL